MNCSDILQQVNICLVNFKIYSHQLNAETGENNAHLPLAKNLMNTFFACDYDQFMKALAKLERDFLLRDRYLRAHYQFYTRAMRVKAYQQFLAPYKSVSLLFCIPNIFIIGRIGSDGQKFWCFQGIH